MPTKILRCENVIDKSCHDIWLSVYIKEIAIKDPKHAEEAAQEALENYLNRWVVSVPEGRDPQLYLNSIISCERAREDHEANLRKRRGETHEK